MAGPSKLQTILSIIQSVLSVLSTLPVVGPGSELASVFLKIFQDASALYQAETGQPFDVTKIAPETPVP
jgi:hypothetical protein